MDFQNNRGKVKVKAPSNIALIKYWGKTGVQLPINPSLSMTLENCHTLTEVFFSLGAPSAELKPEFYFHGEKKDSFLPKITTFMDRVKHLYPFVERLEQLRISSENSFPHSSGIASSASAFAALACAFEEIQCKVSGEEKSFKRASEAARLGSGSACRSMGGKYNFWGNLNGSFGSDEYSIVVEKVHPVYKTAKNAICIASSEEKSVGSTVGHSLMKGHPYAQARVKQANDHCSKALELLENGDVWELGKIIENEAMSLHALMMSSDPSFILMAPNTLKMIELIRKFRETENIPVFFTLDAGPNPHVLYFEKDKDKIENVLLQTLSGFCENGKIILDHVGNGAEVLESHFE